MKRERGTHALVELFGCKEKRLDDLLFLKNLFKETIRKSGLQLIKNGLKFHKFNPRGATGVALLSSSHLSFHSWPEYKYVTLDIFACDKEEKVYKALELFVKRLKPRRLKKLVLKRGFIIDEENRE